MRRSSEQRRRDRAAGVDGRGRPLPRVLGTNPRALAEGRRESQAAAVSGPLGQSNGLGGGTSSDGAPPTAPDAARRTAARRRRREDGRRGTTAPAVEAPAAVVQLSSAATGSREPHPGAAGDTRLLPTDDALVKGRRPDPGGVDERGAVGQGASLR